MALYMLGAIWRTLILPRFVRALQRKACLKGWQLREDAEIIKRRVDYYCRIKTLFETGEKGKANRSISLRESHSKYWFDMMRYLRGFSGNGKVAFINGDTHENPEVPSIGKARRLDDKADNVALMKLDYRRHFLKVEDNIPFEEKAGVLFFRGDVDDKENRRVFMSRWWGDPLFNIGDTSPRKRTEWHVERVSVESHFKYKYILAPEGNDVSSALQWICASNCIPVMTRPTVESWLMHGAMIPGVHYIEVKEDFSDVAEKIIWYNSHPEEARRISETSKEWINQFKDNKREMIINYLVAERYLQYSR